MSELLTVQFLVRLIGSLIGTLAFSVIFNVRARHLPFAGLCGLVTYAIFHLLFFAAGTSAFTAAFFSTAFTALFSEICARALKAPAVVFLLPGVIPTVPGGDLYHTMRCLLSQDLEGAIDYLFSAVKTGIGIAGGIVAVSVIFGAVMGAVFHRKERKR